MYCQEESEGEGKGVSQEVERHVCRHLCKNESSTHIYMHPVSGQVYFTNEYKPSDSPRHGNVSIHPFEQGR